MCSAFGKPTFLISVLKQIEPRPGAIVILGGPGSGKTVLADGIVNELGFALTVSDDGVGPANAEIVTVQSFSSPNGLELVANASLVFVLSDDEALAKYLNEQSEKPDWQQNPTMYWFDPVEDNGRMRLPDWLLNLKLSRLENQHRPAFYIIRNHSGE